MLATRQWRQQEVASGCQQMRVGMCLNNTKRRNDQTTKPQQAQNIVLHGFNNTNKPPGKPKSCLKVYVCHRRGGTPPVKHYCCCSCLFLTLSNHAPNKLHTWPKHQGRMQSQQPTGITTRMSVLQHVHYQLNTSCCEPIPASTHLLQFTLTHIHHSW